MSNEINTEETTGEEGTQGTTAPTDTNTSGISLSKEEFADLIGRMSQMQSIINGYQSQEAKAQEVQNQVPALKEDDINNLTNAQLLQLVQMQVAQPLVQTIMNLTVKEELREVQAKYEDFKDYKEQVYTLASKNTNLSLEDAYLLAKGAKVTTTQKQEATKPETKQPPPQAQKPNTPPTSTVTSKPANSIREAAMAAMKELQIT